MQEGSGHSAQALGGEQKEGGDDDEKPPKSKTGSFGKAATMNCLLGHVSRGKQKTSTKREDECGGGEREKRAVSSVYSF